jgi:hypothetical protein
MSKRKDDGYTDESLGDVRVMDDFLPRPEDLVFQGRERESDSWVEPQKR